MDSCVGCWLVVTPRSCIDFAMAATACVSREEIAALHDNVEGTKEDNVISESGIMLSCKDIEELILLELYKAEEHKQRESSTQSSTQLCRALRKSHGLTEETVQIQLKCMLDSGKVTKDMYRGRESLKIDPELKGEIAELYRITTMNDNGEGLKRRSSRDEEILSKYRSDLVIESLRNESSKEMEKEESIEVVSDAESVSSSDSSVDSALADSALERLSIVEGKVEKLIALEVQVQRLTNQIATVDTEKTEKTSFLENENKRLNDENLLLKKENLKLQGHILKLERENQQKEKCLTQGDSVQRLISSSKQIKTNQSDSNNSNNNAFLSQEQISRKKSSTESLWQKPKKVAKAPKRIPTKEDSLTRNRFGILSDMQDAFDIENEDRQETPVPPGTNYFRYKGNEWGCKVPEIYEGANESIIKLPNVHRERAALIETTENPDKESSDITGKERFLSQNNSRLIPTGDNGFSKISQKATGNIPTNDAVPTEQIERRRRRNVYPGEHSHAEAVQNEPPASRFKATTNRANQKRDSQQKPSVTIISDSMLRRVNRQDINNEVPDLQCHIKCFSEAKVEHMKSYMQPTIDMKPAGLIIMCGTNNLKTDTSEQIAEGIIDLAVHASHAIEYVAVSSIVMRTDSSYLDNKRKQVNALLETNLTHLGVPFIKHDNINESHLDRWGLHPNFSGRHILASNYIDFLNSE